MLIVAGLQVPVMPSSDAAGNAGAVEPAQIAAMAVNVGVTVGVIVMVIVAVVAH